MDDFLMKPKIDFAFKEIMTDEKARIGFLSAILKINPNDIKETSLLKTELQKTHEDEKLGILDVRVLLNNDTEILLMRNGRRSLRWFQQKILISQVLIRSCRSSVRTKKNG